MLLESAKYCFMLACWLIHTDKLFFFFMQEGYDFCVSKSLVVFPPERIIFGVFKLQS